mmetsp:Transcript_12340/g.16163  ORF Transcript_12340/g.16163 Transcript_12340/m.16163 type:complete len:597 (+) Transcript_12340:266-2056(+)|eukprot:CAMPEP_0198147100 /NCGR_PEP_ID=MMETSP1443-20131203/33202_1 /TAXON_ID=186043 /ORGANISM="Entomoneis sp., Strain CCMP2396" /LENGTH=596 /DNA_ID=CAMNT_0043811255 /DNA_START=266 /DNA_END=2056 /DNA_ORIENTATION=-
MELGDIKHDNDGSSGANHTAILEPDDSFDYYPSPSDDQQANHDFETPKTAKATSPGLLRARSGSPFGGYGREDEETAIIDPKECIPMTKSTRKNIVQALYIGIFAIFGSLFRILAAQFFGEECHNPGTVGWLASGSPLCVTNSGSVIEEGGIIFADLPANMLGCLVMGFFANCADLHLAVSTMNIPWLPPTHAFQKMTLLHKAITTGFCGSLTTLSGWNSSMVVLLFGTGSNRQTHVINAVFGYIIGMEAAIGSYIAGKSLAQRFYRYVNPTLANESDAMMVRKEEGVYLNPELPDFERRFLHDLDMGLVGEKNYGETLPVGPRLEYLSQWRELTKHARRVHHPLLSSLISIEHALLVDHTAVPSEAESVAHTHGWNVSSLREWARCKHMDHARLPSLNSTTVLLKDAKSPEDSIFFTIPYASAICGVLVAILAFLLVSLIEQDPYTITDRTVAYSMLLAPPGAILRWILSQYNGKLTLDGWKWFPYGTFLANLIGSILSITLIVTEYRLAGAGLNFWEVGTIRALKVGFVGSLTTVSTFVAEIHGFMKEHTDHAYPYMLTTLFCCGSVSCLIFGTLSSGHERSVGEQNDYDDDEY